MINKEQFKNEEFMKNYLHELADGDSILETILTNSYQELLNNEYDEVSLVTFELIKNIWNKFNLKEIFHIHPLDKTIESRFLNFPPKEIPEDLLTNEKSLKRFLMLTSNTIVNKIESDILYFIDKKMSKIKYPFKKYKIKHIDNIQDTLEMAMDDLVNDFGDDGRFLLCGHILSLDEIVLYPYENYIIDKIRTLNIPSNEFYLVYKTLDEELGIQLFPYSYQFYKTDKITDSETFVFEYKQDINTNKMNIIKIEIEN